MNDEKKTKKQLIDELKDARRKIVELERIADRGKWADEYLSFLAFAREQVCEGIALSDLEGNLLCVNHAFASMHGYSPDELLGRNISILHTQKQIPRLAFLIQETHDTDQFSGEVWQVRKDGTSFPVLMQNSLLRDESGVPIAMLAMLCDTAFLRQNKKLPEAAKKRSHALMHLILPDSISS